MKFKMFIKVDIVGLVLDKDGYETDKRSQRNIDADKDDELLPYLSSSSLMDKY